MAGKVKVSVIKEMRKKEAYRMLLAAFQLIWKHVTQGDHIWPRQSTCGRRGWVVHYALRFAGRESLHTNKHSHFQHSPVLKIYSPSHNIVTYPLL